MTQPAEIRASRLTFVRDVIEPLADDEEFQVVTPSATYSFTKRAFHDAFPRVIRSRSYTEGGRYHFPTPPRAAEPFVQSPGDSRPNRRIRRSTYELPEALHGRCEQAAYLRWLNRKATAHVVRDRKRGNPSCSVSAYKRAIHDAVIACDGRDTYTGEDLDWNLISTYSNELSVSGRRGYKKRFALLPTVDHLDDGLGEPRFAICSWRTNDCKADLSYEEFVSLCRAVIAHAERSRQD